MRRTIEDSYFKWFLVLWGEYCSALALISAVGIISQEWMYAHLVLVASRAFAMIWPAIWIAATFDKVVRHPPFYPFVVGWWWMSVVFILMVTPSRLLSSEFAACAGVTLTFTRIVNQWAQWYAAPHLYVF